jgi:hypothetical protein
MWRLLPQRSRSTTANQTLEIGSAGTLTITAAESVTGGTIQLDGGKLNASGLTIGSGARLRGFGTMGGAITLGGGTVIASGGKLDLTGSVSTATGERSFESLMAGDIVLTLSGNELEAQPIKWIGRRRIDLTAHPRLELVAPIRIQPDAFADNMPHTELVVSPDHAIFVDGKLICARQLINGTTIRQEKNWTSVEYFHIELDEHAILLAEGLPAESYLNTGNRGFFSNADEPLQLHPDLMDEADRPAREQASCAPFVWDEASVKPVWEFLATRAQALGSPMPLLSTTKDPGLHIVFKGRTVRPIYAEKGLHIFALPKRATEAHLVSRANSPTDTRPWLEERRQLGVYVERIMVRGSNVLQEEVPLDHPGLSNGWWALEQSGTTHRRWTNGDAVLPLPAIDGPAMLEIRASARHDLSG